MTPQHRTRGGKRRATTKPDFDDVKVLVRELNGADGEADTQDVLAAGALDRRGLDQRAPGHEREPHREGHDEEHGVDPAGGEWNEDVGFTAPPSGVRRSWSTCS